jgi:hypothetical protein
LSQALKNFSAVEIAAAGNESQKNRRTEAISKIVLESLWKNNNNATNGKNSITRKQD